MTTHPPTAPPPQHQPHPQKVTSPTAGPTAEKPATNPTKNPQPSRSNTEPMTGIEPAYSAWEAKPQPPKLLHYVHQVAPMQQ